MRDRWVHAGRLWTNGDPFLAVDAALRHAWHGYSNDDYDQVIPLGWQDTSIPAGAGRAVLAGADGNVRDDSWIEVFATDTGLVAIVQASGPDYPDVLARALGYPVTDDQDGGTLKAGSGELAIFSAAIDGTGPARDRASMPGPGRCRPVTVRPRARWDPGLLISARHTEYKLKVRWYTRLDEDNCSARWLLIPAQAND